MWYIDIDWLDPKSREKYENKQIYVTFQRIVNLVHFISTFANDLGLLKARAELSKLKL